MVIHKRKYWSYSRYLKHQKQKLDQNFEHFRSKFDKRVQKFIERFRGISPKIEGKKVLCLAARLGEEVMAFRELGHTESLGVDLNPGPDNEIVIEADFHNLPFGEKEFDAVYCNCLDHAWDLRKVSIETDRVLKDDGVVVLDIPFVQNYKDHDYSKNLKKKNKYESMMWDGITDVLGSFSEFQEVYERIPSSTHKVVTFLKKKKTVMEQEKDK